ISTPDPTGIANDGDCDRDQIAIYGRKLITPGVYEENLALTGRKTIRTAHELILSKYLPIPTPQQLKRPEDILGDTPDDYKFASNQGSGEDHKVTGEVRAGGAADDGGFSGDQGNNEALVTAVGFMDVHSFAFNWIGDHPFHYHKKDWYIPQESELNYLLVCEDPDLPVPAFDQLHCHQWLQRPVSIALHVDHRYKKVHYYPNNSYFALLADGGVVIGDGYGAEIRMTGGSIFINAPGDINIEPGRNANILAGYDAVTRAKNCVDISATVNDVRIKAKEQLWLCSSGERSGILIESMAEGAWCDFGGHGEATGEVKALGGIVLKAQHSLISYCAQDMTFRLTDAVDDENSDDNVIEFDCGWSGRFRVKGKYVEHLIQEDGAIFDWWIKQADTFDEPFFISVSIDDGDGGMVSNTVGITVLSRRMTFAPLTVTIVSDATVMEGDTLSLTGTITSVTDNDEFTVQI